MATTKPRYKLIGLLGLLGYLFAMLGIALGIIPYVAILGLAGVIVAGIAWIILGVDLKDNYYKVLGIILVASTIALFTMIYTWAYTIIIQIIMHQHVSTNKKEVFENLIDQMLLLAALISLIIWPTEVFHIVGHFKARRDLEIELFKYSAITRLIALIFNMISTLLLIQNMYTSKQEILKIIEDVSRSMGTAIPEEIMFKLAKIIGLPLVLAFIASIAMVIANTLSAVGFNKLRKFVDEVEKNVQSIHQIPTPS